MNFLPLRRARSLDRRESRRWRYVAGGGSGEALDDVHEVTGGNVEDFRRHGVDDHRLPVLRQRRRLVRGGGKRRFADLVGVFADSERRRACTLELELFLSWRR